MCHLQVSDMFVCVMHVGRVLGLSNREGCFFLLVRRAGRRMLMSWFRVLLTCFKLSECITPKSSVHVSMWLMLALGRNRVHVRYYTVTLKRTYVVLSWALIVVTNFVCTVISPMVCIHGTIVLVFCSPSQFGVYRWVGQCPDQTWEIRRSLGIM